MSTPPPADTALLEEVVALARRAGAATLGWFQSSALTVDRKADGTPVTIADRTAERIIRAHVEQHHPRDGIVGEEEGVSTGISGRTWFIDPIDGTRSFVHGVPLYATLIAVEDDHGAAVGVIELPALGETIAAGRGLGCFWNDQLARVSAHTAIEEASVTRSEYGLMPIEMVERLQASALRQLTWGDGYGYALVATGRLEAMVDSAAYAWDLAPMAVILPEAGGRFTDLQGHDTFRSGSGLASNGHLHEAVRSIVTGT